MTVTQSAILPDHVLGAVLVLAEKEHAKNNPCHTRLAFRSHDFQLQEIFNELRQTQLYPILDAFVFSDCGPEPYSPALNESVSRLQLSGLIGRENPDYEVVFVRPAADRFFTEVLKRNLSEPEMGQLSEVASKFLERVVVTV
jgi:hypothetical protein